MRAIVLAVAVLLAMLLFGGSIAHAPTAHAASCTTGLSYVLERTYTFNDGHSNTVTTKLYALRDVLDTYCGKVYENYALHEASGYCNVNWQSWWWDATAGIWLDQPGGNIVGCGVFNYNANTAIHSVALGHQIGTQIEINSNTPGGYFWTVA
jgi:hypothetical protein